MAGRPGAARSSPVPVHRQPLRGADHGADPEPVDLPDLRDAQLPRRPAADLGLDRARRLSPLPGPGRRRRRLRQPDPAPERRHRPSLGPPDHARGRAESPCSPRPGPNPPRPATPSESSCWLGWSGRSASSTRCWRSPRCRPPCPRPISTSTGRAPISPSCSNWSTNHGLTDHVTLHGYDRNARDALWTASVFLLTSRYEGYPLSTLESLSRGCPVVSYDVPYGPREQITEGVDGYVVPEGDIDAAAARVIELLQDPDLVARMSAAARSKALLHDEDHFLADWAAVLNRVVERSPRRVEIGTPDLQLDRPGRSRRIPDPGAARPAERSRRSPAPPTPPARESPWSPSIANAAASSNCRSRCSATTPISTWPRPSTSRS